MEFRLEAARRGQRILVTAVNLRYMTSWLLASTILCCASIGLSTETFAQQSVSSSAQNPVAQFSIPAQPLPSAINAFIRATGWQVGYSTRITDGLRSTAVTGAMPPAQALRTLLAGTGINARLIGANTATLVSPNVAAGNLPEGAIPLDTIDVQGGGNPNSTMTPMPAYAGGQVATGGQLGMLGNRSVMDTPFNQTSYTQKTIQNQHARTIEDVIVNNPSVTILEDPSSGFSMFTMRGFQVRPEAISVNGLYGIFPRESVAAVERVEVLNGPSALLTGMPATGSAIGGSVNLVPKRASDEPLTQLTTSYISRSQLGEHLDVGRRFGENKEFGIRFNGAYRNGNGPFDANRREDGSATLGLDYRSERVRLSADLGYQNSNMDGVTGLVSLADGIAVPSAPDPGKNFFPSWTHVQSRARFGALQGEIDLTNNVTAYAAIGANRTDSNYTLAYPTIDNARGDWTGYAYQAADTSTNIAGQAGLRATVDTGPVQHALNLNISQAQQTSGYAEAYAFPLASNIYNPVYIPNPGLQAGDPAKASESKRSSVGIADTLSIFDKRIQLTVGVRRQQVKATNFDTASGIETSSYDEYAWSPAYALVVKPWENVSLYANYIEGLEQGAIAGASYSNAGQIFPPYQSKQYEAGVKIDWGRLTTTVSAFQISRPNTVVVAGAPLPTLALDGEQRNRGIEVNAFGELAEGIRLLGGVTFFDARLTKTSGGLYDGNKATAIPNVNVMLGGEWDTPFLQGLTLTGRINYFDETFLDPANTQTVPSWTRLDLGARYTFSSPWNSKPITVRFDVQNVFDSGYWLNRGGTISLAPPRTFLLSTTFNF